MHYLDRAELETWLISVGGLPAGSGLRPITESPMSGSFPGGSRSNREKEDRVNAFRYHDVPTCNVARHSHALRRHRRCDEVVFHL